MPWILLTAKLPTRPSPPRLSIHWATPWPDEAMFKSQKARLQFRDESDEEFAARDKLTDEAGMGWEANWDGAMGIEYMGERLRVFRHEFSEQNGENMRMFIHGLEDGPGSHELVPGNDSDAALLATALETDLRSVYEAALLDGCNQAQAMDVVKGIDITNTAIEFPPLGWYRCKPEYGLMWATEDELAEE